MKLNLCHTELLTSQFYVNIMEHLEYFSTEYSNFNHWLHLGLEQTVKVMFKIRPRQTPNKGHHWLEIG